MTYLRTDKHGAYEVRVAVPPDCVATLGKKNLTKRLGVRTATEARRLSLPVVQDFLGQIEAARKASAPADSPPTQAPTASRLVDPRAAIRALAVWKDRECETATLEHYNSADDETFDPKSDEAFEHTKFQMRLRNNLEHDAGWKMIPRFDERLVEALATSLGVIPIDHPIVARLRPNFQKAWLGVLHHRSALAKGEMPFMDEAERLAGEASQINATASPTLMEVFELWWATRKRAGAPTKTYNEYKVQIERFDEIVGVKPVSAISRANCKEFRDIMAGYPVRPTKSLRMLPIRDAVARARSDPSFRPLDGNTLNNKVYAAVRGVLQFAVEDDIIEVNPMARISVLTVRDGSPKRLPYSDEELGSLFSVPPFVRGPMKSRRKGDAAKWLPLIALFTGARREEMAQLVTSDFKEEAAIPYIHFQTLFDNEDMGTVSRRLKNVPSRRKVPIHSQLIACGLLKLVEQRRRANEKLLFPEMNWAEEKKSEAFGKWWGRFSRTIIGPDKRKVFHSFRHTVSLRLKNASVEQTLIDALLGHASDSIGAKYGLDAEGLGYSMPVLRVAIESLRYPQIHFDTPGQ